MGMSATLIKCNILSYYYTDLTTVIYLYITQYKKLGKLINPSNCLIFVSKLFPLEYLKIYLHKMENRRINLIVFDI